MPAPFSHALDSEISRIEAVIARSGQLLSASGVVLSFGVIAFVGRNLGLAILILATVLLAWFTTLRLLLARGLGTRLLPVLSPLVEISLPTILSIIDTTQQGPVYAASVSVPLQLYAIFTLLQILRLRPFMPALVGAVGAAQYLATYFLLIRPALPPDAPAELDPPLAFMRATMIVLGGVAATLVSLALRRAVGNAQATTRSLELFGKYRLIEKLADGGMGFVYRALYCPEGGFKRPVALKRVHEHLAANEAFVTAFRHEAELSSRLLHPNIVQVIDFGKIDTTYFLAMEFVDGCTLDALMKRSAITKTWVPLRLVVHVGREMLKGLHFAHRVARDDDGQLMRVVHRDLNPPNVLLAQNGAVKISDFGIARAIGTAQALLTQTIAGKAAYMAPEQARADAIDERSDLFAVGIILWELVTLKRLFVRGNDMQSLAAVLEAPAPKPSAMRDVPAAWDAFFERALQKDPAQRFSNANEMSDALGVLLADEKATVPEELHDFLALLPASVEQSGRVSAEAPTIATPARKG